MNTIITNTSEGYSPVNYNRNISVSTYKNILKKNRKVKLRKEIRVPAEPIKSKTDIEIIKDYLLNKKERYSINQLRDYTLFCVGIDLSRRIGDLLKLTINDFLNNNNTFKKEIIMITQKRQKQETIIISKFTKEILTMYFNAHPELLENRNNNLFPTRESHGKSMNRKTAWDIMKKVQNKINSIKEENDKLHLSTHSLRKTKAYQYVIVHKDDEYAIDKVSHALGHNDKKTTFAYLGLDKKELEDYYNFEI